MHGIWLAWRLLASQEDYLLYYLWHKGKLLEDVMGHCGSQTVVRGYQWAWRIFMIHWNPLQKNLRVIFTDLIASFCGNSSPVLRRGVIWGEGAFFKRKPPLYEGKYDTFEYDNSLRSITLLCEINNIHIYVVLLEECQTVAATSSSEYCYMVLWDITTDLTLHTPYSQRTGSEQRYSGWERDKDWRRSHTHTRTARTQRYRLLRVACSWWLIAGARIQTHSDTYSSRRGGVRGLKKYYRGFL